MGAEGDPRCFGSYIRRGPGDLLPVPSPLVAGRGIHPEDPSSIRRMFEVLAPDYDRLNSLLTFGLVRGWRRALVRAARLRPGDRVVDVATGTGPMLPLLRAAAGGRVVGVDFTEGMLRLARGDRVLGDALALPFPDQAFDAAVSGFALRDVADQGAFVAEMARVTRAGGRVALLEIGRPLRQPFRVGFDLWFRGAVPRVAAALGQGEAHRFLVRSLDYLPEPDELRATMRGAGLVGVGWRELSLGAARLFWGTRGSRGGG
jgi:demethylmenaquinone methyltransferase/2-methoxy-6-polyprenyl-1,4-benzoquinol methylase